MVDRAMCYAGDGFDIVCQYVLAKYVVLALTAWSPAQESSMINQPTVSAP